MNDIDVLYPAIAGELRLMADDIDADNAAGAAHKLRKCANELDPPKSLPTELGWYPNVTAGPEYRPGALRTSNTKHHWVVMANDGYAISMDDDRVAMVEAKKPRIFADGDPCPELGTILADKDGDTWVVSGRDSLSDYGADFEWKAELNSYGPMREIIA